MQEQLPLDALSAALPPEFDDLRARIVRFLTTAQKRQPSETDKTGQPVRVIEVKIDNEVAQELADRAAARPLVVRVEDPRKLSDKVRGMSRRLFPKIAYLISPYTFRHATAADLKARRASVESVAKVLGQVVSPLVV